MITFLIQWIKIISSFLLILFFSLPIDARAATCASIEEMGVNSYELIMTSLKREIAKGVSYRLDLISTFKITNVQQIILKGCELEIIADVTLKRVLSRDAKGQTIVRTDVEKLDESSICFRDISISSLNLSRVSNQTENLYKRIANSLLPKTKCIVL